MTKIQSGDKSVDGAGFVMATPACRCDLESANVVQPESGEKNSVRNGVMPKRSRMLIRVNTLGGPSIFIGGDGVNASTSYPLNFGDKLDLPVSPNVLVFSILAASVHGDMNMRTLETG